MPRIPPEDGVTIPETESASFATMKNLFRTMGHRPGIMQATMQLLEITMREGTVEPQLKELLAVRVSQVNHCFY